MNTHQKNTTVGWVGAFLTSLLLWGVVFTMVLAVVGVVTK